MTFWLAAALVLMVGLVPCGVVMVREPMADGLAALELAGTITVLILMVLAEAFGQPSIFDIALAFVVLSYPSGLVFAHFLEAPAVNMGDRVALALLGLGVVSALLGALGLLVLRGAFDRFHVVGPVAIVGPTALAAAVVLREGLSQAGIKAILVALAALLVGPIVTHATARAEWVRRRGPLDPRGRGRGRGGLAMMELLQGAGFLLVAGVGTVVVLTARPETSGGGAESLRHGADHPFPAAQSPRRRSLRGDRRRGGPAADAAGGSRQRSE